VNRNSNVGFNKFTLTLLATILLIGCNMKNESIKVSTDILALQKIVILDMNPTSGKWEIFGTPEYTGGAPAPTDFITLIAEIPSTEDDKFRSTPHAGGIWIAPESARPWISNSFRTMLEKSRNLTVDFSKRPECRSLTATLRQTKKKVEGFSCNRDGRTLLYLTVADYTRP
jgi:hypothetical protein